jgi:hypothetical protein
MARRPTIKEIGAGVQLGTEAAKKRAEEPTTEKERTVVTADIPKKDAKET